MTTDTHSDLMRAAGIEKMKRAMNKVAGLPDSDIDAWHEHASAALAAWEEHCLVT